MKSETGLRKLAVAKRRSSDESLLRNAGVSLENIEAFARYANHVREIPIKLMTFGMVLSPAYRAIGNVSGWRLFPLIFTKGKIIPGKKNDGSARELPRSGKRQWADASGVWTFSYKDAAIFGFSSVQFNNGMKSLVRVGFVDVVSTGNFRNIQRFNQYQFSDRWRAYGSAVFQEIVWPSSQPMGFRKKNRQVKTVEENDWIGEFFPTVEKSYTSTSKSRCESSRSRLYGRRHPLRKVVVGEDIPAVD